MDTDEAYRCCEKITWSQARNFAYGIRLLPAGKRRALAAVYAFARRIDDIGDGAMPAAGKLAALEKARASIPGTAQAQLTPPDGDPVIIALGDVAKHFAVPMAAFGELIDGCVADVRGRRYETFGDLLHYCRCVAGSIGRLSLGVFGTDDPGTAEPLADSLGVALQLTNILRDIREDYRAGRVYLPAEDLDRFGCTLEAGAGPAADPAPGPETRERLTRLIEFETARARDWYATGMALLPMLDRRSAACTGAMAGIYARLLGRIAADPAAVLAGRVSLPPQEKAMVAARSLAGMAYRPRGGPGSGSCVPSEPAAASAPPVPPAPGSPSPAAPSASPPGTTGAAS